MDHSASSVSELSETCVRAYVCPHQGKTVQPASDYFLGFTKPLITRFPPTQWTRPTFLRAPSLLPGSEPEPRPTNQTHVHLSNCSKHPFLFLIKKKKNTQTKYKQKEIMQSWEEKGNNHS